MGLETWQLEERTSRNWEAVVIDAEITEIHDSGCVGETISVTGAKVFISEGRLTQGSADN